MKIKIIDNITRGGFYNIILIGIITVIFLIIVSFTLSQIYQRHNSEPYLYIHDSAIQLEEAIKFILKGKNPYTQNYFGTPLENWYYAEGPINPALYHFITPPHFLFSILFF